MYLLLFSDKTIIVKVGRLHERLSKQIKFTIISPKEACEELVSECNGRVTQTIKDINTSNKGNRQYLVSLYDTYY